MSFGRNYQSQGGTMHENHSHGTYIPRNIDNNYYYQQNKFDHYSSNNMKDHIRHYNVSNNNCTRDRTVGNYFKPNSSTSPSVKRRRFSENDGGYYAQPNEYEIAPSNLIDTSLVSAAAAAEASTSCYSVGKRDRSCLDDEDVVLMSKEEIERCSPSRKDGIDALHETRLRYSYCAFIQNLGMRLDIPQTTMGTAMVLCHRFFVRRSHVCHDRFLIASAALFLASKYEETPRPLNDVVKASCEIIHKQSLTILSYMLPIDWFEQFRERITEAEQLILTTLNFELSVQHPYDPLTSILNKLGLSQTLLVDLALNLVSEGFRSSLWLQFKPHQIAAGIAYVSAKLLNVNLNYYLSVWREFQSPPDVLQDVEQQLMELF